MSFSRSVPDPEFLARFRAALEAPLDEQDAMIDAFDEYYEERFAEEVEADPEVRREWENFLFSNRDDFDSNSDGDLDF